MVRWPRHEPAISKRHSIEKESTQKKLKKKNAPSYRLMYTNNIKRQTV